MSERALRIVLPVVVLALVVAGLGRRRARLSPFRLTCCRARAWC